MMIEEIRENMKKELDQQKTKVQQAAQQRAMIAQQGEMLEKQQAENKLVLMELGKYSRVTRLGSKLLKMRHLSELAADHVTLSIFLYAHKHKRISFKHAFDK